MGLKSIKIINLLSFDELIINDIKDVNCFVGKNNTGKSNLMKLINFFYQKLEGKRILPPELFSNYNAFGSITIGYDISRIGEIVTSPNAYKNAFFRHIYNVLFKGPQNVASFFYPKRDIDTNFELTLKIHTNESISWSENNKQLFNIINYLYPFFKIETRHIDLYDWDKLWYLISRLKSFNTKKIKQEEIIDFFDKKLTEDTGAYKEYLSKIQALTETSKYSYREKVLNYVKTGLKGQTFLIDGENLNIQSDGTNSYKYLELFCKLLITLTRREYITPALYVDEPEIGLHPKKKEQLINNIFETYTSFKKTKIEKEKGKYKTPNPKIIFSTHSPNVVKQVIKNFEADQQILHFSKTSSNSTKVMKMNSNYNDRRFLNVFSDNEARLFFSNFILFVEGQTELELFNHNGLSCKFKHLRKIDIYASSDNVLSEHINPSYTNTSIPYLFLFDLDKIFNIKPVNGKIPKKEIVFKNNGTLLKLKGTDLDKELEKFKRGYSNKHRLIYKNLLKLKNFDKKELEFDTKTFKFSNYEFRTLLNLLENYTQLKNVFFVKTTIEETLINTNSKALFFDWIKVEYGIKNLDKKIKDFEKKGYGDDELFLDYLRILFGGKFETLINNKLITKGKNQNAKDSLDYVSNMIPSTKKTSGWVTNFLDYSIAKINAGAGKKNFDAEFNVYFPELYKILYKTKV